MAKATNPHKTGTKAWQKFDNKQVAARKKEAEKRGKAQAEKRAADDLKTKRVKRIEKARAKTRAAKRAAKVKLVATRKALQAKRPQRRAAKLAGKGRLARAARSKGDYTSPKDVKSVERTIVKAKAKGAKRTTRNRANELLRGTRPKAMRATGKGYRGALKVGGPVGMASMLLSAGELAQTYPFKIGGVSGKEASAKNRSRIKARSKAAGKKFPSWGLSKKKTGKK